MTVDAPILRCLLLLNKIFLLDQNHALEKSKLKFIRESCTEAFIIPLHYLMNVFCSNHLEFQDINSTNKFTDLNSKTNLVVFSKKLEICNIRNKTFIVA